jgi:molybdopterin/thiamine biosynthesis adenylyltransferase
MGNGAMAKGPQATAPILDSTISEVSDLQRYFFPAVPDFRKLRFEG